MRKNRKSTNWLPAEVAIILFLLLDSTGALSAAPAGDDSPAALLSTPVQSVWPPPPDPPRIRWMSQMSQFSDFTGKDKKKKQNWFAAVAGAPSKETEQQRRLGSPFGITIDSHSRVFVADWMAGGVVVFDGETHKVDVWGAASGLPLRLPIGVAVDDHDRLFVSDSALRVIYCVSREGKLLAQFGQTQLQKPAGLAIDKNRSLLYVTDVAAHRVAIFNLQNFELVKTIGGPGPGSQAGQFRSPIAVAVDHRGFLYVVDTFNHRIQIFNRLWRFVNAFGTQGDGPGMFSRPKGIAVDSEGHIYVADAEFNNFQIFDPQGQVLMFVGTQGIRPGQFTLLTGLCIDEQDRIYTTEQRVNPRVQIFQYLSQPGSKN